MFLQKLQLPSTQTVISVAASAAATTVLIRSLASDYLPRELRSYVLLKIRTLFASFSSQLTLIIEEFEGLNHNLLFQAARVYVRPTVSPNTRRFRVTMPVKETKISVTMEMNEEIVDSFDGVQLKWKLVSKQIPSKWVAGPGSDPYNYHTTLKSELLYFELSFHKKHKDMVLQTYLPYVLEKSKEVKEEKKTLKLFTMRHDRVMGRRGVDAWQSVNLDHPSTFETLAMDMDVKATIMEDLELFVRRKEFYRKVGKAWKRGYLLFGPPGTGKSSLVAAMANYLNFDIYDLELTDVRRNSELRKLLISTANRSILVVEDIDCSIELQNRLSAARAANPMMFNSSNQGPQVTLSGLLNFIDGLWSSCGDERIIVFTTNHRDRLDPALLRPGRMDVHIHLSYCTPCGFKMLASNYLEITEHPLFSDVEQLMETAKVTPAEVGEQLLKNEEPDIALRGLIEFLERKKREGDETKASKEEVVAPAGEGTQEVEGKGGDETEEGQKSQEI